MITAMDGCTGIPDVIAGMSIRHCCDAHDQALFDNANVAFCPLRLGCWAVMVCSAGAIRGLDGRAVVILVRAEVVSNRS